jgi:hypothetical protein
MRAPARGFVLGLSLLLVAVALRGAAPPAAQKDIGADPRKHHYYFAHRLLRQVFFDYYDQFYPRLAQDPQAELTALWQHVANGIAERERLPSDGLAEVGREKKDGREVVIIALPEAKAMAEAVFVVLISGERTREYLTYEKTISFVDNQPLAVLCGWTADGHHLNFGMRSTPDRKGLDEVLAKYLAHKPAPAATSRPGGTPKAREKH